MNKDVFKYSLASRPIERAELSCVDIRTGIREIGNYEVGPRICEVDFGAIGREGDTVRLLELIVNDLHQASGGFEAVHGILELWGSVPEFAARGVDYLQ